ncbi:hypothetical protein RR46_10349 [Papilio xuthus]|uniref:Uncharacterized protein n=1 Tax=Papilio xuthus TaxID=66420 RepID=A0A194Q0E7_PAPXU|nr:hypothetical protein RR46_10349 [Papilio xuthus]
MPELGTTWRSIHNGHSRCTDTWFAYEKWSHYYEGKNQQIAFFRSQSLSDCASALTYQPCRNSDDLDGDDITQSLAEFLELPKSQSIPEINVDLEDVDIIIKLEVSSDESSKIDALPTTSKTNQTEREGRGQINVMPELKSPCTTTLEPIPLPIDTPNTVALRKELRICKNHLLIKSKKVKNLQKVNKRLRNKVANLKTTIEALRKKSKMTGENWENKINRNDRLVER